MLGSPAEDWNSLMAGARGDASISSAAAPPVLSHGPASGPQIVITATPVVSMRPVAELMAQSLAAAAVPFDSAGPLRALLHLADFGIALLDASGAVSFANDHAQAMFDAATVVTLRRNQLQCAVTGSRQSFDQARDFQCDAARSGTVCAASVLRIPHTGGHGFTVMKIQQLALRDCIPADPWVVVFMFDSLRPRSNAQHTLRELYGLSGAEAKVANLLADGHDIPAIARRMNIAKNTVRAHLRSTYAKTGTKKQAQLVARLCRDLLALESLLR